VRFKEKRAYVTYEKGVVTIERMIKAVRQAGFQARLP